MPVTSLRHPVTYPWALVAQKLNSILKTFASALELLFTAILSWIFFGIPLTLQTLLAIFVVSGEILSLLILDAHRFLVCRRTAHRQSQVLLCCMRKRHAPSLRLRQIQRRELRRIQRREFSVPCPTARFPLAPFQDRLLRVTCGRAGFGWSYPSTTVIYLAISASYSSETTQAGPVSSSQVVLLGPGTRGLQRTDYGCGDG